MRLAVAATPQVAIPTLDYLTASEHELAFVVTRADRPSGRGQKVNESEVARWAVERGIAVAKPRAISELKDSLTSVDLLLTIAFGRILPLEILSAPKYGSINMHFSLLPQWRGAAPVQRAIEHGDTNTGITIFALDEGMDTGPVFIRESFPISPSATSGDVLESLSELGPNLIKRSIELISSGFVPSPQSELEVSYARKISTAEAEISWDEAADKVLRSIRAFTPEPGSWTTWRKVRMKISRARRTHNSIYLEPGTVSLVGDQLIVACGSGTAICIDEVIPSGKKSMSAMAWSNGARLKPGERFGE